MHSRFCSFLEFNNSKCVVTSQNSNITYFVCVNEIPLSTDPTAFYAAGFEIASVRVSVLRCSTHKPKIFAAKREPNVYYNRYSTWCLPALSLIPARRNDNPLIK